MIPEPVRGSPSMEHPSLFGALLFSLPGVIREGMCHCDDPVRPKPSYLLWHLFSLPSHSCLLPHGSLGVSGELPPSRVVLSLLRGVPRCLHPSWSREQKVPPSTDT